MVIFWVTTPEPYQLQVESTEVLMTDFYSYEECIQKKELYSEKRKELEKDIKKLKVQFICVKKLTKH